MHLLHIDVTGISPRSYMDITQGLFFYGEQQSLCFCIKEGEIPIIKMD